MKNAQEYLNQKYPKTRKKATKTLDISGRDLGGELKLEEFIKLEEVCCQNNQLTKIHISDCSKLVKLFCSDNPLVTISLDGNSIGWEKFQEDFKDCLKGKLGKQYYDLRECREKQLANQISPKVSIDSGTQRLENNPVPFFNSSSISSQSSTSTFQTNQPLLISQSSFFSTDQFSPVESADNLKTKSSRQNLLYVDDNGLELVDNEKFFIHASSISPSLQEVDITSSSSQAQELNAENRKQKWLIASLQKQLVECKIELNKFLKIKESNFQELVSNTRQKLDGSSQEWLEVMLEIQLDFNNDLSVNKLLERAKNNLRKKLTIEEMQTLLDKRLEFILLEKKINSLRLDPEVVKARNILIIGRMGSGKSTLANVIINKNGNFEEVFTEDESTVSVTKQLQVEEVEIAGINYRLIDTVGIGDAGTVKSDNAVLEVVKATYAIKEGISQILFVIGGRNGLGKKEVSFYNALKETFGEGINEYTTIVRTHFTSFINKKKCEDDANGLRKSGYISGITRSCRFIHIDNPPLKNKDIFEHCRKSREESQRVLLTNLITYQNIYLPSQLEGIIANFDQELVDRGIEIDSRGNIVIDQEISSEITVEKIKQIVETANKVIAPVSSVVGIVGTVATLIACLIM